MRKQFVTRSLTILVAAQDHSVVFEILRRAKLRDYRSVVTPNIIYVLCFNLAY